MLNQLNMAVSNQKGKRPWRILIHSPQGTEESHTASATNSNLGTSECEALFSGHFRLLSRTLIMGQEGPKFLRNLHLCFVDRRGAFLLKCNGQSLYNCAPAHLNHCQYYRPVGPVMSTETVDREGAWRRLQRKDVPIDKRGIVPHLGRYCSHPSA